MRGQEILLAGASCRSAAALNAFEAAQGRYQLRRARVPKWPISS